MILVETSTIYLLLQLSQRLLLEEQALLILGLSLSSLVTCCISTGGIIGSSVFFLDKIEKSVLHIVCFPAHVADIFSVDICLSLTGTSFAIDVLCGILFSLNLRTRQKEFSVMFSCVWQPMVFKRIFFYHL